MDLSMMIVETGSSMGSDANALDQGFRREEGELGAVLGEPRLGAEIVFFAMALAINPRLAVVVAERNGIEIHLDRLKGSYPRSLPKDLGERPRRPSINHKARSRPSAADLPGQDPGAIRQTCRRRPS